MGIAFTNQDQTERGYNDPEHPDNETEVPLTRASVVEGPMGLRPSDEPETEPTQEELDSVEDLPEDVEAITDDTGEAPKKPAKKTAAKKTAAKKGASK